MVSNFPQYSPQGLASQFSGLQGAGWPQMNPGQFGQPGMSGGNVSFGQSFGQDSGHPAQHLVTVLGQLAQQLAAHAAVTQQIGIALHQLTQQLAQQFAQQLGAQSQQGYPGGFGAGQAFAGIGPPYASFGQPFGPGGAWGANRQQTIQ